MYIFISHESLLSKLHITYIGAYFNEPIYETEFNISMLW